MTNAEKQRTFQARRKALAGEAVELRKRLAELKAGDEQLRKKISRAVRTIEAALTGEQPSKGPKK